MPSLTANPAMFAFLGLSGGEMVLVLVVILILFAAKKIPDFARGLGEGISEFRQATKDVTKELDQGAHDAGASLGGIYCKHAAQALTPDNQTAELYDPAVFRYHAKTSRAAKRRRFAGWVRLWRLIRRFVSILWNSKI